MSRAFFIPLKGKSELKSFSQDHATRDFQINQMLGGFYEFVPVEGSDNIVLVLNEERYIRNMHQNKHITKIDAEGPVIVMKLNEDGEHAELTEELLVQFKEISGFFE